MKKRILAGLLTLAMVMTMTPLPMVAEGPSPATPTPKTKTTVLTTEASPSVPPDEQGTTFQVSNATYKEEMQKAATDSDKNIVLELTENLSINDGFAGIPGKSVTVTSSGKTSFTLPLATDLVGDVTLDNVNFSAESLFANGHRFETTERAIGTIQSLYGGGSKSNDVNGDTTIILRGGTISKYLFGGGLDSNVSGNTHIVLDGANVEVDQLFGGGRAHDTDQGRVGGNVTIDFRKGLTKNQFGGGRNEHNPDAEVRTPASVAGTVTVNLGYKGAEAQSVNPGMFWYSKGGSYHSTVGNIRVNITDGVYIEKDASIIGCGYSDTVLGTVEMHVYGKPDMHNNHVYGGGIYYDSLQNSGPIRILNRDNKKNALSITYNVPNEEDNKNGIYAGSYDTGTEINGDILAELLDGNLGFIDTSERGGNTYVSITGRPKVVVRGGRIAEIHGDRQPANGHETIATVTDGNVEVGYFDYLNEVNIQNNAVVNVDSEQFNHFEGIRKPFYNVDNLNITGNSTLTTCYSTTKINNNVTMNGSTWHAKGQTYIEEGMYTKASRIYFDTNYQIAKNYDIDSTKDVLLTSDGDTFVAMNNGYLNAIHCSINVKDSTWAVLNPLEIHGNATFDNTVIQLPVVGNQATNNYPNTKIPLKIDGLASGSAQIETVASATAGTNSSTWNAEQQKPALGDNYIVCWAPDGTDTSTEEKQPIQSVFSLKNDDAIAAHLYLRRQKDANKDNAVSYFMGQVAKGILVTFDKNGGDTDSEPQSLQTELIEGKTEYQLGVPTKEPTRAGYTFKGWNTEADGTGTPYTADTAVTESLTVYAQWEKNNPIPTYTVTYTDGVENEVIFEDQTTSGLQAGDETPGFQGTPERTGYTFKGWLPTVAPTVIGNAVYVAQWQKNNTGGSGGHTKYILHYESNGGTDYKDERYNKNTVIKLDKTPIRENYTFTGWYADEALSQRITNIKMTVNKTVYAGWKSTGIPEWLNGKDHFAYVVGYVDGTVRPLNQISRAEVATIFFRLLNEDIRKDNLTQSNSFTDVKEGMWHNTPISTMSQMGILFGRTPEQFDPNAPISRAEFAAICARFDNSEQHGHSDFTDIAGHWAEQEIERAASLGWISGYTDGTFRPNNAITRAEAMTMINRMLKRLPENEDDLLEDMNSWPDNRPTDWYYLDVQEATNSHEYTRKDDAIHEHWVTLMKDPDWTQYN